MDDESGDDDDRDELTSESMTTPVYISTRSLTLSQWRDLRMGVICEDL